MEKPGVQIQSVIYGNEKKNLERTLEYLANAVRVERNEAGSLGRVRMVYGDGTPEPVFSEDEILALQEKYREYLDLDYKVFGFNTGSAKGHNILAEDCSAEYMLIMNPDVLMAPRCLAELMYPFHDEKVGMVEARQTPVEHPKEYDIETKETEWATTACAVFKTEIFRQLEGFDSDSFFLYCDDVDFSWRLRLAGYKIIYNPLALVYHAKRLDSKGQWEPTKAEVYYSAEASLMMAHKWSNPKQVDQILRNFMNSTPMHREIAEKFIKKRNEGALPAPLDPEHKVSKFVEWHYADYRFII